MDLAEGNEERRITFPMTQAAPQPVMTSPSGRFGDRWSPLRSVHRQHREEEAVPPDRPWHFFLDHDWMHEMGEALLVTVRRWDMTGLYNEPELGTTMVFRLLFAT